jgi:hypothetical protein
MTATYEIGANGASIKCLDCGMTSWSKGDVDNLYCGNCHEFHDYKLSRMLMLDEYFADMVAKLEIEMTRLCEESDAPR